MNRPVTVKSYTRQPPDPFKEVRDRMTETLRNLVVGRELASDLEEKLSGFTKDEIARLREIY